MINTNHHFSSKLLLFGEHTVVRGSSALAIPYPQFHGHWKWLSDTPAGSSLQQNLKDFALYLKSLREQHYLLADLNIMAFSSALEKGLYFASNIPTGYGLGSSGALCAAVYTDFAKSQLEKNDPRCYPELKKILAQMEGFFHGSSSGIDPLICYLNRPILIQPHGQITAIELPSFASSDLSFFLLDTKISRKTSPLVTHFLTKCKNTSFLKELNTTLVLDNEAAIMNFLQGQWDNLYNHFINISRFQLHHLPEMIPAKFLPIWKEGLQKELFYLKLCGAGGGGFLLGLTKDKITTKNLLKNENLLFIN